MMISSHSLIGLTFFIQSAQIENDNLKFNEKNLTIIVAMLGKW